jgi:hypothetical protein
MDERKARDIRDSIHWITETNSRNLKKCNLFAQRNELLVQMKSKDVDMNIENLVYSWWFQY